MIGPDVVLRLALDGAPAPPGSVHGLQIVIDDADAAHAELSGRGVRVSEVQDLAWGRFVYFSDPDGNAWSLQQLPRRG